MKKKKGVCHLESGHVIRAQFEVDEDTPENEAAYSHPFTGEACEMVEFEEDDDNEKNKRV